MILFTGCFKSEFWAENVWNFSEMYKVLYFPHLGWGDNIKIIRFNNIKKRNRFYHVFNKNASVRTKPVAEGKGGEELSRLLLILEC